MCQFASLVLTKDGAYWSKFTDSHSQIVEEFGLHEDGVRGPNVLKVEFPIGQEDLRKPVEEWPYEVDQDVMPEWFEAGECERRARKALVELVAYSVSLAGRKVVKEGRHRAYESASVEASGSASVIKWDQQAKITLAPNSDAVLINRSGSGKPICIVAE